MTVLRQSKARLLNNVLKPSSSSHSAPSRLRYLAAVLDVRAFLLTACLLLSVMPQPELALSGKMDRALFALGNLLQRDSIDARAYIRIDLPADETQRFLHDPVSAVALMGLLEQLQQTYTRGAALVLPQPFWRHYSTQDFLLAHWHEVSTGAQPATEQAFADMTARMRVLVSVLANDKIFFATQQNPQHAYSSWRFQYLFSLDGWQQLLQPGLPVLENIVANKLEAPAPLAATAMPERALLWQADDAVRPDARLELFMRQQGLHNPAWLPGQGLQWPSHFLRTSYNAAVYPRFSAGASRAPVLQHYSLQQLATQDIRRLLHEKTVVIGEQNDSAGDDLLYSVLSLEGGYYAVVPSWLPWLRIAIAIGTALLILISQIISIRFTAILTALLLTGLMMAQQIFLLLHREWLPLSDGLLLLMVSGVTLVLWKVRRQYYPLLAAPVAVAVVPAMQKPQVLPAKPFLPAKSWWQKWFAAKNVSNDRVARERMRNRDLGDDEDTLVDTRPMQSTLRMPTASPANKQRQFLGRYQVQRELGRGAMGVVYLGFDPKIARQVAIKTLHYNQFDASELSALKERFFREAEAAGRLRHPNIVTIYDAGEELDLAYIAMDYVSGSSLAAHVRKGTLLDVEMVYWIMAQVADAVSYANAQGIIHRDIKPSNILFDGNTNEVKVADFGIARIMDGSATRTKTGDILGSPLYMAPEQLKGEAVSARSDVFSLGVTFYQLLTGELPFKGDNLANLSFQIVQGKFKSVDEVRSDLPDSARKIINKAMQKNPDNRYSTAGEMAEALQRALTKEFA